MRSRQACSIEPHAPRGILAVLVAAFVLGGLVFVVWGARFAGLGVPDAAAESGPDADSDADGADALADWIGGR